MDIAHQLSHELLRQDFVREQMAPDELDRYKMIACHYARVENALSVLSDMRSNTSYIYYGGFSKTLGLTKAGKTDEVCSIWEDEILKLAHPDDLKGKYLGELRFFHFIKRLPKERRFDFFLMDKLRMRDAAGHFLPVTHRLFYLPDTTSDNSLRLALCLYTPQLFEPQATSVAVNSLTGEMIELGDRDDSRLLSDREKQVLRLIDQGMTSKRVAETLIISINTVSRHRQAILEKLRVGNSIEACRVARTLGII